MTVPAVVVHPVTQGRVVRAEWIKMRTLRSTVIVLALTVVAIVGIGLLIAAATKSNHPTAASARADGVDPIGRVLGGVGIAQLTIGVLGVLSVTGEYSTGMIRATLGAVPKRLPVLWAKLATFAGVVAAVCNVQRYYPSFAGQAVYEQHRDHVLAPWAGFGLFVAYVAVAVLLAAITLRRRDA